MLVDNGQSMTADAGAAGAARQPPPSPPVDRCTRGAGVSSLLGQCSPAQDGYRFASLCLTAGML